ncbi:hypothetical protein TRVL_10049 [Trypanosoma vivax]|nr:hypothetical protein TRVL_10049 [Trypanosoma vivax]
MNAKTVIVVASLALSAGICFADALPDNCGSGKYTLVRFDVGDCHPLINRSLETLSLNCTCAYDGKKNQEVFDCNGWTKNGHGVGNQDGQNLQKDVSACNVTRAGEKCVVTGQRCEDGYFNMTHLEVRCETKMRPTKSKTHLDKLAGLAGHTNETTHLGQGGNAAKDQFVARVLSCLLLVFSFPLIF